MKITPSKQKTKNQNRAKRLALLFCMIPNIVLAQKDVIVFHNCENMFYPDSDSLSQNEYSVEGKKHWTFERYKKKKNILAKTYIAAGKGELPSIIGLCEIESDKVLNDLCKDTPLRKGNYKFIHYNSEDLRGIDVALLYNPSKFTPLEHCKITYPAQNDEEKTRDVLYVCGMLGRTRLNLYVVHAPSRREHNIKKALRQEIFDSVYNHISKLREQGETNFIVMGDMNDNPWDSSIEEGFHTRPTAQYPNPVLVNLMQKNKDKAGSYVYGGEYYSFDQFLVSTELCPMIEQQNNYYILRDDFLVEQNPKNKLITPYSTYRGMYYQGGISDHFPIVMTISHKSSKPQKQDSDKAS